MVSFSCEACGDILKKPKLDQHAQRCRGAYYTCVDCNNTFDGRTGPNGYSTHTSCMSEEQRYHKSVYKEPKKKGKQQQQQQQNQSSQPAESAPPAPVQEKEDSKKRSREDESSKKVEEPIVNGSKETEESTKSTTEDEPSKKKKKKSKKNNDESTSTTTTEEPKKETLSSFLSTTLPSLLGESVSIISLREKVLGQAKEKGFTDEKEVEKALFEGMTVGGKKSKVKYEFA